MANLMGILDNAFVAVAGVEPTLTNYSNFAMAMGILLTFVYYAIHFVQCSLLQSMTYSERADIIDEIRKENK